MMTPPLQKWFLLARYAFRIIGASTCGVNVENGVGRCFTPAKKDAHGKRTGHETPERHLAPAAGTEKNEKAQDSAPRKEEMRKGKSSR
jgi:hypothetical protein